MNKARKVTRGRRGTAARLATPTYPHRLVVSAYTFKGSWMEEGRPLFHEMKEWLAEEASGRFKIGFSRGSAVVHIQSLGDAVHLKLRYPDLISPR